MSKFNLTKLSETHGLIKTAGLMDKFVKGLVDPASGKLFSTLIKVENGEVYNSEAHKSRTKIYRDTVQDVLSNKMIISTLTSLWSRLKDRSYTKINDFYAEVQGIIDSELSPELIRASSTQSAVTPAVNTQNKRDAEMWIKGMKESHATADFLYLYIKDMIKYISDKDKFSFNGLGFDATKFETLFHHADDNKKSDICHKYLKFNTWKTFGEKTHAEETSNSSGDLKYNGLKDTGVSGWKFLYGSKSGFPIDIEENEKLLQRLSAEGWCTGSHMAKSYITNSEKFYLYFKGGDEDTAAVAIVLKTGGITEMQEINNQPPSQYLSQIDAIMQHDGLAPSGGAFGMSSGWKINQVMKWYEENKYMSDETFVAYMMKYLPNIDKVVNSQDNVIDLSIKLGDKGFFAEVATGDMSTQLAMGISVEMMQKPTVRALISKNLDENNFTKGGGIIKEIIRNVFYYILKSYRLAKVDSFITQNLRSLLTTKSLPPDQEELMFRDDEKTTLQQIVTNMVYK